MWNELKKLDKKLWNCKIYKMIAYLPRKVLHILRYIKKNGMIYTIRAFVIKVYEKTGGVSPLVSVVMPVYNVEEYLEQAIESLLNQSMKHIEIIAVDDGSTDCSLEILKRYESLDKRVKVFSQKNQYAGVARNLGLSKAKGEYILFLDSDDFFENNLVKETYYVAKMNKADIVMFGANYYNDSTGRSWKGRWLLDTSFAPKYQPFNYKDCPDTIFQITTACPWTKIFRRKFIEETGLQFQNLHNANDVFFVLSAIAMAKRVITLDKPFVNYRIGLKQNLQSSKKRYFYEAYSAWHDKLIETDLLNEVRKSYINCALGACLYNLRAVSDYDAKKIVYEKVKNEAIDSLELWGYEESYYINKKNYEEMCFIKENTFERYVEEYVKDSI